MSKFYANISGDIIKILEFPGILDPSKKKNQVHK